MKKYFLQYKAIFFTVLLIGIVLVYVFSARKNNYVVNDLALKMQTQLQLDEGVLEKIMLDLQEVLLINGKEAYEQKSLEYQKKYKDHFAFFLYENNVLNLWTDNHIPIPEDESLFPPDILQHLGSYQVLINKRKFRQFSLIAIQVIKLEYPWENDYLINHIPSYFNISADLIISKTDGVAIVNNKGQELFFIQLQETQHTNRLALLPFVFFSLSFFVFALIIRVFLENLQKKKPFISLLVFTSSMFLWFFVHLSLGIPEQFFQSKLFSPALYANLWLQKSLGHLFFMSLSIFLIVIYYFSNFKTKETNKWWIYLYLTLILSLFYGIIFLIKSLVFDSQLVLNLYQLASLNTYSYIALWVIFILFLSWFLLVYKWLEKFKKEGGSELHIWLYFLLLSLIPILISNEIFAQIWGLQFFISVFLISVYYLQNRKIQNRRLGEILFYLVFFTFISSTFLNVLGVEKEKEFRKTTALTQDISNDPFLEAHFISCISEIAEDNELHQLLLSGELEHSDTSLLSLITKNYFKEYSDTYHINLIHCEQNSLITILPDNIEEPCYDYFEQRISKAQDEICLDTLYLIQGSYQYRNYIGIVNIQLDSGEDSRIFIEFVSRVKPKEMGLPAILEKSHSSRNQSIRNYSYAIYNQGVLTEWYGKFDYKQKLSDYRLINYHDHFYEIQGYDHYIYSKNNNDVFIISLETPGILQRLASFAFIFLFYSILVFILYSLIFTDSLNYSVNSFQGRLQYSMVILLLFSFILIGITSLYYIFYLNQSKNEDILLEKAHSVLIELEHKISGINDFDPEDQAYVESLLIKFSEVFFTDITLYNKQGDLLASSRPEMFTATLLSARMDADAFYQLSFQKNSYFIQHEKIGVQTYLSAYLPFRNQDNQSVAYLNLPYFAKQYELEEEVSGFIVAFLNIYLFLLFITILITVVISRYLSKPIQLIKDKLQHLDLQHTNEKIDWHKDDEIGELIKEYNRMVDELNLSAQQLALNQRESAWREMAQQIAHEIKNPLTPMKLNVQYLQKAWDDDVEDYEDRMKKITKALQEQIDVLSDIAGQFSTFAAIDKVYPEVINLRVIIDDVVAIFKSNQQIVFETSFNGDHFNILADKNQMIRVYNNLYKNAIQAIGNHEKGLIRTDVSWQEKGISITISDNGCGIGAEELTNIFEPRFTTKTGGMGLGLSLVKKMLENASASISVESVKEKGSKFSMKFPSVN
ncbi:MAG: HAMP domain-containing protein [Bacteroidales bacterium]|nr:HAMP domain-containing protein [Bacteroidales bacterium]